jgi:hypothetical protein
MDGGRVLTLSTLLSNKYAGGLGPKRLDFRIWISLLHSLCLIIM